MSRPRAERLRRIVRSLLIAFAMVLGVGATTGVPARAAGVALTDPSPSASSSCGTGTASASFLVFGSPFKLSAPSAATTGDLLVLTIRTFNDSNFFGNFTMPDAQLVNWKPLLSSGNDTRTYYRFRTAGDPSQYTLISGLALVTASASISASMTAFTGADTATPFATTGAQSTGTGTGSGTLPDTSLTRGGSLRMSAVTTDKNSTFDYSGSAPLTETCHVSAGASVSQSTENGFAPATTPTHALSIGGAAGPAWVAQTYVIQPPLSTCQSGGLNLTTPPTVAFPSTTLTGFDQKINTTATFNVNDQTGLMAGWNLSGTSTTFTNGSTILPANAMKITGLTVTAKTGNCSAPVGLFLPLTLPAGLVAPAAATLASAGLLSGSGPLDLKFALELTLPANVRVGTYTSDWTVTLGTGP